MNTCPTCGDHFDSEIAFCPKDGAQLSAARGEGSLVGTIVADRYRITSRIGAGGMGTVYKAEHIRMKRQCAIKVLRGRLLTDTEAVQRFQREAENASQLSHPNVAQIYDFGEHGKIVYLAMEFIDGESLAGLLQRQPAIHPDIAADIIAQSAAALEAAHTHGVLHRDVKPDNIMLAKQADGTYLVKLVDFGIARAMTSDEQRVTKTGLVIGTPEYMSPEQLAGEELDARSDLYALGLVAFQCLTGKDAFPKSSSKQNLILRLTSRPQSLADVRNDVPWSTELQNVFDRALAPDPRERYDDIGQFATELSQAISDMTPSQTSELYRMALQQRVANVASRTPRAGQSPVSKNPYPPDSRATAPNTRSPRATSAAPLTGGDPAYTTPAHGTFTRPVGPTGSGYTAPLPPRADDTIPMLRRRPRIMSWVLLVVLGGWGYLVATGRTDEARAVFDSLKGKVTGAIGSAGESSSADAEASDDARTTAAVEKPPAPASARRATKAEDSSATTSPERVNGDSVAAFLLTAPPPTVKPPVSDSSGRVPTATPPM